jgi:toxin ParE1/3/4
VKYRVRLVAEAEEDLLRIVTYISANDSAEGAGRVLDGIERAMTSLETLPERGHIPPELERIAVRGFREVHFKPYRVIYEVCGREVLVHAVLDGRRDMMTLLERRMTRV